MAPPGCGHNSPEALLTILVGDRLSNFPRPRFNQEQLLRPFHFFPNSTLPKLRPHTLPQPVMEASPEQIAALADELAILAKGLAAADNAGPMAKRNQTHAVVMKAKSLINQIQDPLEACIQHTTNVSSTRCQSEPSAISL